MPAPTPITRYITRVSEWDRAYNVYAKRVAYPSEPGDGILVGQPTILPWETGVEFTWTPPGDGDWKLVAEPIYEYLTGPIGRLN